MGFEPKFSITNQIEFLRTKMGSSMNDVTALEGLGQGVLIKHLKLKFHQVNWYGWPLNYIQKKRKKNFLKNDKKLVKLHAIAILIFISDMMFVYAKPRFALKVCIFTGSNNT